MTGFQLEIQLTAIIVAAACALPGTFLVLRRMAMMSDAISHAVLPGIVVAFFLTGNLSSPLLIVGGAATGLLTVVLVEAMRRTRLVREDAAIGLVFPALFSIGVILIARFAGDVHLDIDAVLLGELAFVPFDRWVVAGVDLGPVGLYATGVVGAITGLFIALFYKELKLATFDAALCAMLGFMPTMLHYALMGLVSATAVVAFDAVGAILVIALMVGPPAAAYLLTDHLHRMIGLSIGLGATAAVAGYWVAHVLDASIAGSMASIIGLEFALVFAFAPHQGLFSSWHRRRLQRWEFARKMLAIHLLQHEGRPEAARECRVDHLQDHLQWEREFAGHLIRQSEQQGLITREGVYLHLTAKGRSIAQEAMVS